jgi:hypothetical protein
MVFSLSFVLEENQITMTTLPLAFVETTHFGTTWNWWFSNSESCSVDWYRQGIEEINYLPDTGTLPISSISSNLLLTFEIPMQHHNVLKMMKPWQTRIKQGMTNKLNR